MLHGPGIEQSEEHVSGCSVHFEESRDGCDCDRSGRFERKTVGTTADRRKGDALAAVVAREREAGTIARSQQLGFARMPIPVHRAYGVNDMSGHEVVPASDPGGTGRAPTKRATFSQQTWPGGLMDGTVDAPAPQQGLVGRIDNGIDIQRRDVTLQAADARVGSQGLLLCGYRDQQALYQMTALSPLHKSQRLSRGFVTIEAIERVAPLAS